MGTEVSPAHAGMDPSPPHKDYQRQCLPRARGDGPIFLQLQGGAQRSPPRTRGWTQDDGFGLRPRSVSPAHAGMDPTTTPPLALGGRLPRARGDGPATRPSPWPYSASPPRTRGWTHPGFEGADRRYVSPAHAGMDRSSAIRSRSAASLPRARGDGPTVIDQLRAVIKSPPRTRGWTFQRLGLLPDDGVSPAHAGMDPRRGVRREHARRLPRARGDGPL